ncbi:type II toxin-antitoxin system PemK/MazF family toxin [Halonotius sp. GCM10025705]|uniref:type II toxin-antitoxin system PemK/MazF family toxin n=1 Tax=Halonotius sp. GCM10025705 TaxID=3252678 RepID=UPI00360A30F0
MTRGQLPNRIRRGDVVWVDDPFGFDASEVTDDPDDHPYVIISTDAHPFHGTEYLAMLMTTTKRTEAISVKETGWEYGSLSKPSYISPWTVVTVKDSALFGYQGQLEPTVVDTAVEQLPPYVGL